MRYIGLFILAVLLSVFGLPKKYRRLICETYVMSILVFGVTVLIGPPVIEPYPGSITVSELMDTSRFESSEGPHDFRDSLWTSLLNILGTLIATIPVLTSLGRTVMVRYKAYKITVTYARQKQGSTVDMFSSPANPLARFCECLDSVLEFLHIPFSFSTFEIFPYDHFTVGEAKANFRIYCVAGGEATNADRDWFDSIISLLSRRNVQDNDEITMIVANWNDIPSYPSQDREDVSSAANHSGCDDNEHVTPQILPRQDEIVKNNWYKESRARRFLIRCLSLTVGLVILTHAYSFKLIDFPR
jgi:hypothetical protein